MGKQKPFGIKDKLGYMFGDIGNDFTFIFASSYVMVFYSKVMVISTGIIGTMFLIARCLDAFTDIGMGRLVDVSGILPANKVNKTFIKTSLLIFIKNTC